mgnify:CR=1 FL=1
MKTSKDPRHIKRIKLMQELFSWQFAKSKKAPRDLSAIISHLSSIDKLIAKSAPDWPINQINKIDLAILRLAVFELTMNEDTPPKVVIDEAVELGKEFGADSSPGFINGALGKLVEIKKIST